MARPHHGPWIVQQFKDGPWQDCGLYHDGTRWQINMGGYVVPWRDAKRYGWKLVPVTETDKFKPGVKRG